MARTTQELLERLLAFLPPQYQTSEPLLAGVADALQAAEGAADELLQVLPFGPYLAILPGGAPLSLVGASGIWLDLHASGYGLLRAPGETDDQLRTRLRNVEDAVTRPAILAAVKDANTYTDIEMDTLRYLRDHYKWAGEADTHFRNAINAWNLEGHA